MRINTANALQNLNSLWLSWLPVGGFMGARLAKQLPGAWVRVGVIVTGLVMSAVFFARLV